MFLTKVRPGIRRNPVVVNHNFDQLFNQLLNVPAQKVVNRKAVAQRPAVNVIEADDHFRIDVAAPGLNKEDFKVEVENDTLTISAKKEEVATEGETFTRREFKYLEFERQFHLPETIDVNQITATMKNGILSLNLAKKEEAKELPPRKIDIA